MNVRRMDNTVQGSRHTARAPESSPAAPAKVGSELKKRLEAAPARRDIHGDGGGGARLARQAQGQDLARRLSQLVPGRAPVGFAPDRNAAGKGGSCPALPSTTTANTPPLPGTENLTPAQQAQARAAVDAVRADAQGLDSTDAGTRDRATVATADALRTELTGLDPAVQAAVLKNLEGELEQVGANVGHLSRDDTAKVVNDLTRATESVGQDNALALTDPFSRELAGSMAEHPSNLDEFNSALTGAITDGRGALLGSALTVSLEGREPQQLASMVGLATANGIGQVQADFDKAQDKAEQLNGEAGLVAAQAAGVFSEEQIQAGLDAFHEDHKGEFDKANDEAERAATTLEGAAFLQAHAQDLKGLPPVGDDMAPGGPAFPPGMILDGVSGGALKEIPRIGQTAAGSEAINDAVQRGAGGASTFITGANAYAATLKGDDATRLKDGLNSALGTAAAWGMEQMGATGDLSGAPALLDAYSTASGDPAFAAGYRELASTARTSIESGSNAVELGVELADKSGKLGKELFPARNNPPSADDLARQQKFLFVGAAVSTAAFIQDPSFKNAAATGESVTSLIRPGSRAAAIASAPGAALAIKDLIDHPSVHNGLSMVSSLAGLGKSFAVAAEKAAAGKVLGNVALVAGVALSAVDAFQALERGDELGALSAGSPAIGAGIGFAVGGPAGAAVGFAVGSVVGVGIDLLRKAFGDDPIVEFEKRTESFWRGALDKAGLPPDAAAQLRDVNGDLQGCGQTLAGVAQAIGVPPLDLLKRLATLPPLLRGAAVKNLLGLPNNGKAIMDALADGKTPPPFQFFPADLDDHSLVNVLFLLYPSNQVPGLLANASTSSVMVH